MGRGSSAANIYTGSVSSPSRTNSMSAMMSSCLSISAVLVATVTFNTTGSDLCLGLTVCKVCQSQ